MAGSKKKVSLAEHIAQLQEGKKALQKHIAPFAEMQQQLQKSLNPPYLKMQKQMQKSLLPILEAQKKLQESLRPLVAASMQMTKLADRVGIPKVLTVDMSQFIQPAIEFRRQLEGLISPAFIKFVEFFKTLPERMRNALLILGMHGWFLDLEMSIPGIFELEQALEDGNVEDAEQALIEHYRKRLIDIEENIKTYYPRRARVLSSAFKAHRRGEYELSIPVLLAQTDGICQELINIQLFSKKDKKPATADYVESIAADVYRKVLLFPLIHSLPISASANERGTNFTDLNRHQVLHGESVDYGTEINSLKAISLLNYIAHTLKLDDEQT